MLLAQTNPDGTPLDEWIDNLWFNSSGWVTSGMVMNVVYAVVGLIAIFCGYFVARYLARIVSGPICKRVDETLGRFVGNAIFYSVMIGLITFVASNLGFQLGGLTAILAATGFAIGLAFQGTLSNFASGVLMIVFRPFKVGDVVNIAGVTGKVNEIDLFTTTLDTPDNRRLIIPNSSISGSTIENISFHPHRRIEILIGVDYKADIDATRQTLQEALDLFATDTIQGEGRGNKVVLANLGSSSVEWKVRMWVASSEFWKLQESLTGEIKRRLDRAGIGIPYPQMDVHLRRVDNPDTSVPMRPKIRPARRPSSMQDNLPYAG
ncbi:mechanosensitive ion channel family protein [Rhodopirellula sp. MGV]|uniref:mechanosensitive ion channel family protein n=1 Tax=Rhodopirellula sp. MGV TaxID=2023130 RepID=UPI001E301CB1|nr:mechanosensitive ion channel domain-containing protein [Rhodopirellula sp. MGV]